MHVLGVRALAGAGAIRRGRCTCASRCRQLTSAKQAGYSPLEHVETLDTGAMKRYLRRLAPCDASFECGAGNELATTHNLGQGFGVALLPQSAAHSTQRSLRSLRCVCVHST